MNIQQDFSGIIILPFTSSAAPSSAYLQLSLAPTGASGSGVIKISQADIFLASDLGIAV